MLVAYIAVLATFLILDAVWLRSVMRPIFEADVPELLADKPRLGVAAGFYAFYCAGIVLFAVRPGFGDGGFGATLLNGALLGLMAYGCYESTNMATLRGWSWRMVAIDVAWGAFLTAVSALAGLYATQAF